MKPLRTLIADDEAVARQVLREELNEIAGIEIAGEATNGREAYEAMRSLAPDLVLLDVQMPVIDGFEALRRLDGALPPAVVFITAYDEHALRAFDAGAADYLLKPVGSERLRRAVERARRLAAQPGAQAAGIARLLDEVSSAAVGAPKKIVGRRGREYHLLDSTQVLACRADGELVWLLTEKGKYLADGPLQSLEQRLEGRAFRRVSRSVLVNFEKVSKMAALSSQRWLLTLEGGLELTVSKRQASAVRAWLGF